MEIAAEVVRRVHGSQRWLQSNPRKTAQCLATAPSGLSAIRQRSHSVSRSPFHAAECCKAGVFVKDLNKLEAGSAEPIQLPAQSPRGVFSLDVSEDLFAIIGSLESCEVLAISPPHEFVQHRRLMRHQVPDPERSASLERSVNLTEDILPF